MNGSNTMVVVNKGHERFSLMMVCMLALACPRAEGAIRYAISRPTVNLLLSHELESQERTGEALTNSTMDTTTSRQQFDIRTSGWIYHPALAVFSVGLKPQFEQQSIDRDPGLDDDNNGTFLGYFLDTTLLQYKPYTLNLNASRDRDVISSRLSQDSTTESNAYRATLFMKYPSLPTSVMLESRERTTQSFYLTSETVDRAMMESRHATPESETSVEAELLDISRTVRGFGSEAERMAMKAINQYKPGDRSKVRSSLHFTDYESTSFDRTTTVLSSWLSVDHHEQLNTRYELNFANRDERNNESTGFLDNRDGRIYESTEISALAGLTHQLYENLRSSLTGEVAQVDDTGGELDIYGAIADFRYTRPIPWGRLNINLGRQERIRDSRRELAIERYSETLRLVETELIPLDKFNIDPTSIRVTDIDGVPFVEGIDYVVTSIGNNVYIQRTLFGEIAEGQEVLVDYEFDADPSSKTAASTNAFGIDVDLWSMLSLYYQWSDTEADLLSGAPSEYSRDRTLQRVGTALRWNWSSVRSHTALEVADATVEALDAHMSSTQARTLRLRQTFDIGLWSTTTFESEDTTVDGDIESTMPTPTKILRIRQRLSFRPTRYLSFGLGANYGELERTDTGEQTQDSGYSATVRWNLGAAGRFSGTAISQRVQGFRQDSERRGLDALHEWRYGAWIPRVRYTFLDEDDRRMGETRKINSLFLSIERKFR